MFKVKIWMGYTGNSLKISLCNSNFKEKWLIPLADPEKT